MAGFTPLTSPPPFSLLPPLSPDGFFAATLPGFLPPLIFFAADFPPPFYAMPPDVFHFIFSDKRFHACRRFHFSLSPLCSDAFRYFSLRHAGFIRYYAADAAFAATPLLAIFFSALFRRLLPPFRRYCHHASAFAVFFFFFFAIERRRHYFILRIAAGFASMPRRRH
jgi:hypothetical protein